MTIYSRPDGVIFASGAKQGEIITFPDLVRGWGVTLDTTNGIPPMEFFNFTGNRLDKAINYLLQTGVPEHSGTTEYPQGAIVQSAGQLYIALQQNTAKEPQWDTASWANLTPPASTSKAGIVALSNDTASTHEDIAATSLAVKTVFDLAQKAIALANTKTDQSEFDKFLDHFVGVPLPWHSMSVPDGFIAMNGDRFNTVAYPKLAKIYPSGRTPAWNKGYFMRGIGGNAGPILEPQGDAIRNIVGFFRNMAAFSIDTGGVFAYSRATTGSPDEPGTKGWTVDFNASRVVPTAPENRPISMAVNFICLAR